MYIEVSLGSWVRTFVSTETPPEGVICVQKTPPVYSIEVNQATSVADLLVRMGLPLAEVGLVTFMNKRIGLETLVQTLDIRPGQGIHVYPMIVGG